MSTFKVTISRIVEEEVEMDIEADKYMEAFDETQKIVSLRNQRTNKQFYIKKVEKKDN